jgi:hypothetical protein
MSQSISRYSHELYITITMVELLDWAKSAHGNAASIGDDVGTH